MSIPTPPTGFVSDQESLWKTFTETLAALSLHLDRCLKAEAKIKLTDYKILAALMDAGSTSPTSVTLLRMRDLARITSASPSRLTYQIHALEDQGWVAKVPVLHDRRGKGIVITPLGQQAYLRATPIYTREVQRAVFSTLDPSVAASVLLFSRTIQNNLAMQKKAKTSPPIHTHHT